MSRKQSKFLNLLIILFLLILSFLGRQFKKNDPPTERSWPSSSVNETTVEFAGEEAWEEDEVELENLEQAMLASWARVDAESLKKAWPCPEEAETVELERVVDGDTFVVRYAGKRERLRLLNVNCPESFANPERSSLAGEAISRSVKKLLTAGTYSIIFDRERRDEYGRLLALMWLPDGSNLNASLLASGFAKLYRKAPNTSYWERLKPYADLAREEGRGIWAGR